MTCVITVCDQREHHRRRKRDKGEAERDECLCETTLTTRCHSLVLLLSHLSIHIFRLLTIFQCPNFLLAMMFGNLSSVLSFRHNTTPWQERF